MTKPVLAEDFTYHHDGWVGNDNRARVEFGWDPEWKGYRLTVWSDDATDGNRLYWYVRELFQRSDTRHIYDRAEPSAE